MVQIRGKETKIIKTGLGQRCSLKKRKALKRDKKCEKNGLLEKNE